ncbi:penicillin-binding protein 1A [Candidatus Photodesmus katoptron]|uniref:Penicillin-binding protein 1A n=1 Tax=Candidatus Photodesmus katoptron Akat1 TaxID=1236703 RepID=S3DKM6_9GAMM|nr:penicillin-binding protein 1A [Candidatus Photodesmus katoptron Akat1]KEY90600.1 penicillin-binding protein 1A [Candidatus Photodesmus katoptron]
MIGFFYYFKKIELPNVAILRNVKLQTPMKIFSQDGKLIAQFGEKRRIPISYDEIPEPLINALIATEDTRFYEHFGIDPIGIIRAAIVVALSGSPKQGASTITQQLARNFFLSNEKKFSRKIKEILIALCIEQVFSKEEIIELYVNKIFLGQRTYGFAAAAQTYFGKDLQKLSLSEIATLAGIPKAPSTMNPIYSLKRAIDRRNLVLSRMLKEKYITQKEYYSASHEIIKSYYHSSSIELHAPYIAELVRSWVIKNLDEDVYTSGISIYTTIDSNLQKAANQATIDNLFSYDERHGYRGPEKIFWKENHDPLTQKEMKEKLSRIPTYGQLIPAIVTKVDFKSATVFVKCNGEQIINWNDMSWARRFLSDDVQGIEPTSARDILTKGEQVWVRKIQKNESDKNKPNTVWALSQIPNANTAFVAMNPKNGAVLSLVGGFNFLINKFNRVTQSVRQVGSSMKPFIYSAAIDHGMTLASLINDAPINQWDKTLGIAWRPKNSPASYSGPTRLRVGLAKSKNVMAVRLLRKVGLDKTRQYLTRFGFNKNALANSETIALGSSSLTPLEMVTGYSIFANGGFYIKPFFIDKVEGQYGEIKFRRRNSNDKYTFQVISEQTAFLVREMLYSNIWGGGDWLNNTGWNGTGWRAQKLQRHDIGGKTGTTNESKDAWYHGYAPGIVATAWVGFDNHNRDLGRTQLNKNLKNKNQISGSETGAKTAQTAWIDFMRVALKHEPIRKKHIPPNIVRVRIDRSSGLLTDKFDESSMFEYFIRGSEPKEYVHNSITDSIYNSF